MRTVFQKTFIENEQTTINFFDKIRYSFSDSCSKFVVSAQSNRIFVVSAQSNRIFDDLLHL